MRVFAVSLGFALLAVACTSSPGGQTVASPTSVPPAASPGGPTATAATSSETTAASPLASPSDVAPADGPPAARLAAEGGDPVTGQLGTYVWGDQGSDSPWLPGAPIAVGKGEPLTVRLSPRTTIASWQARIVDADASGPDGARPVGRGSGTPRFEAPRRGAWTLEVHLAFADGAGDASYFWRLDVQ